MGGYGFSSLNKNLNSKNNNTNLLEVSSLSSLITAVRVIYILLDDSDPIKFKKYGGWNGLGTIEYESITSPGTTSFAFPLYSNLKNYPLINEIVYTISFPSTSIGKANTSERKYYLNTISLWNHPHHNAYPTSANTPPPEQRKDYIETQLGSAKIITDENKQISLGKTFYERSNIHPLLPFEGDVIQEGRWGNSIRLGSTVGGSSSPTITNDWSNSGINGDPITIFRNGQGEQTDEGWIPITENINNDKSSIYLTSTQIIPLKASSTNYTSYESSGYEAPITPDNFNDNQIILNSGRLIFNSNNDHILLSSAKSINLNSKTSVNIDTDKFIVQSNNTYLGNIKLATEPLMLGKKTTDLLRDLINKLTPLVTALQSIQTAPTVPSSPVVFLNLIEPTTNLLIILNSLKTELGASSENCTLISKNNFTV
jgi:hypothetical protein